MVLMMIFDGAYLEDLRVSENAVLCVLKEKSPIFVHYSERGSRPFKHWVQEAVFYIFRLAHALDAGVVAV